MTDEQAFIRTICTYPDETGPRLIYADWLEENGHRLDPENYERRVAFIRGSTSEYQRKRERSFRERLLKQSIAGFPKSYRLVPNPRIDSFGGWITSGVAFVNVQHGFIEQIVIGQRAFLRCAKGLFESHPIQDVFLANQCPGEVVMIGGREFYVWNCVRVDRVGSWPEYAVAHPIWAKLNGDVTRTDLSRIYENKVAAFSGLSNACVAFGRELAGLPPIERGALACVNS